jgi:chromosome segregation ATPase
MRHGERIPSWITIRNLIGKGSSNDINRGKEDFRQEHGLALRNMTGFVDGVPGDVTAQVQNLWSLAVNHAANEFESQSKHWQLQLKLFESERDQAAASVENLNKQLSELKSIAGALKEQVAIECIGRKQAERLLETNQQEISDQRERLRAALDNSQDELKSAISRLEGAESHALMEIERVKSDSQKKMDAFEAYYAKEKSAKEADLAILERKLQTQTVNESSNRQKIIFLEQENCELKERLKRDELLIDKLSSDNAQLVTTIGKLANSH